MTTHDEQEMQYRRNLYFSFLPGMGAGVLLGLLLGAVLTLALYFGWIPLAQVGQFFASGLYPALIVGCGMGIAIGGTVGALIGWKR